MNAFVAAGAGFLLAVLWFDLMFDVQVRGAAGRRLPEQALASIAAYYGRVTTAARPMNRLVATAMLATLAAIVVEIAAGRSRPGLAWASLALAAVPIALAGARTVPGAVRLGTRADPPERQSELARSDPARAPAVLRRDRRSARAAARVRLRRGLLRPPQRPQRCRRRGQQRRRDRVPSPSPDIAPCRRAPPAARRSRTVPGRVADGAALPGRDRRRIRSSTASATDSEGQFGQQDRELLATPARDRVALAEELAGARRELAQQLVAGSMSARVVEVLEAVHVEQGERQGTAWATGRGELAGEGVLPGAPVWQPGEAVGGGLRREPLEGVVVGERDGGLVGEQRDGAGGPGGDVADALTPSRRRARR